MYQNENYKEFKELPEIPKGVKKGIYIFLIILSLVLFRVLAVTRIPANTVGVRVSAFGGPRHNPPNGVSLSNPIR